jgi:3-oxoacyl-[acyl-carrier-protein] synthase II
MGIVSPLGIGKEAHWAGLASGRTAITRSERLASQDFPVQVAAVIPDSTLHEHLHRLPRKQLKLFSRVMRFGMIASALAVEDSALGNSAIDPTRCGVFLGTFFTTLDLPAFLHWMSEAESTASAETLDLCRANSYCMTSINPVDYSLKTMPNLAAGHIAIGHNAQGFCRVIADGCTGGLQAVGQAFLAIRENQLDMALCGGAEAPLEEFVFVNLCTLDFLGRNGAEADGACRPFDTERSGAVLGEGAAMLILEEWERARGRGAPIYGEIVGYGVSAGDATVRMELERVKAVAERVGLAMESALGQARVESVDLIAANGDSTRINDLAEARAIRQVFGTRAKEISISASKPMHGHLISGSGPLEMSGALLALNRDLIPPTLNLRRAEEQEHLNYVSGRGLERRGMQTALVNTIGLFGESASVVVRKADGES